MNRDEVRKHVSKRVMEARDKAGGNPIDSETLRSLSMNIEQDLKNKVSMHVWSTGELNYWVTDVARKANAAEFKEPKKKLPRAEHYEEPAAVRAQYAHIHEPEEPAEPISLEVALREDARTEEFFKTFFPKEAEKMMEAYRAAYQKSITQAGLHGALAHFEAMYSALPPERRQELTQKAAQLGFSLKDLRARPGAATIEEFTAGGRATIIDRIIDDKIEAAAEIQKRLGKSGYEKFWKTFDSLMGIVGSPNVTAEKMIVATTLWYVWPEARADIESVAQGKKLKILHDHLRIHIGRQQRKPPGGGGPGPGGTKKLRPGERVRRGRFPRRR